MDFAIKFSIIFITISYFFIFFFRICLVLIRKKRILQLVANEKEVSPNVFFAINNVLNQKQRRNNFFHFNYSYWNERNSCGVYILFNKTKNKCYVGQSKKIFYRIINHFSGRGNHDVYYDYHHGDTFTIKIIPLIKSNYTSLNKLERHTIMTFKSYRNGYNKTRGNRGN